MELVIFWGAHLQELQGMVVRHLLLVALSTGVAIAIGVPAGIVAARRPRVGTPIVAVSNVAQTIPSLALLGFLLPLPIIGGVGPRIAVVALIAYALLPIVRGTMTGIQTVDPSVRMAGTAMGMTSRQLLWLVELPLALPSIVGGIRVAAVVAVGTATIAAAVGAGGLGEYIFRGLSMVDSTVILAGAIPAAAVAIAADASLAWVQRRLQPGRTQWRPRTVGAAGLVAVLGGLGLGAVALRATPDTIVVGSKNFTEQIILGEVLAQQLERHGLRVTRRLNLGGTFICDRALRSGDIDLYAEYTGTALTAIFREPVTRDRAAVLTRTRERYADAGITMLPGLGFDNTFAVLVRRADADRFGLRAIGDLQRIASEWSAGFGYEFIEREDGYRGLTAAYGLTFEGPPRVMDLTLMYRALASGEVDVIAGDATSGLISSLDLAMLEDDRRYFPPYDAVPVARTATLLRYPRMREALAALEGKISVEAMQQMNRAVDVDRRDAAEVARAFLDRMD